MIDDKKILEKYYGNKFLTVEEVKRLYDLVRDPWNLGGEKNKKSNYKILKDLESYLDLQNLSYTIDYGCGVGTTQENLYKIQSEQTSQSLFQVGIDFPVVLSRLKEMDVWSTNYLIPVDNEYDFITKSQEGRLDKFELFSKTTLIIFFNSIYYLFKEKEVNTIKNLSQLVTELMKMTPHSKKFIIMCAYTGFSYPVTKKVLVDNLGFQLYHKYIGKLENENPDFSCDNVKVHLYKKEM